MHGFAIVMCVLASIAGMVAGLITLLRRDLFWQLTSVQQFGAAVISALVATMLSTHSQGIDLVVMAAAVALGGLAIYVWHVRSGRTTPG